MFLSEQQQQHDWNNRDLSKADLYKTHLREWIVVGVDAHAAVRGYKTIPEQFGLHKSNQSDRWCSTMKERLTIKDHSHSKPCYSHQGHKGTVAGLSLSLSWLMFVLMTPPSGERRTAIVCMERLQGQSAALQKNVHSLLKITWTNHNTALTIFCEQVRLT